MPTRPRPGVILGEAVAGPPIEREADHFIRFPACNGWIDLRDLGQVFDHADDLPHDGSLVQ